MNKELRNQVYNDYVKEVTPTHNLGLNMLKAFITGGIICLLGQIIVNVAITYFGISEKDAPGWCSYVLVLLSVILTKINN